MKYAVTYEPALCHFSKYLAVTHLTVPRQHAKSSISTRGEQDFPFDLRLLCFQLTFQIYCLSLLFMLHSLFFCLFFPILKYIHLLGSRSLCSPGGQFLPHELNSIKGVSLQSEIQKIGFHVLFFFFETILLNWLSFMYMTCSPASISAVEHTVL